MSQEKRPAIISNSHSNKCINKIQNSLTISQDGNMNYCQWLNSNMSENSGMSNNSIMNHEKQDVASDCQHKFFKEQSPADFSVQIMESQGSAKQIQRYQLGDDNQFNDPFNCTRQLKKHKIFQKKQKDFEINELISSKKIVTNLNKISTSSKKSIDHSQSYISRADSKLETTSHIEAKYKYGNSRISFDQTKYSVQNVNQNSHSNTKQFQPLQAISKMKLIPF